jgi:hypothetical protein
MAQKATSGKVATGCDAIILAGKCTGVGDDKFHTFDYIVKNRDGGAAILENVKFGLPIRVFRSSYASVGFFRACSEKKVRHTLNRYDGLYQVVFVKYRLEQDRSWQSVSLSRLPVATKGNIYQFTMSRVEKGDDIALNNRLSNEEFIVHCIEAGTMYRDGIISNGVNGRSKQK